MSKVVIKWGFTGVWTRRRCWHATFEGELVWFGHDLGLCVDYALRYIKAKRRANERLKPVDNRTIPQ